MASEQRNGDQHEHEQQEEHGGKLSHETKMYLRFAGMIATAMVVMYWTMFVSSWEWSHVRFSESRVFMALTMGGTMGLVMLAWMLGMYRNVKGNIAIIVGSLLLFGGAVFLDRSQVTVDDRNWMGAMIPHHSLAITRSERADIDDVRVCQLAVDIIVAQQREIAEMEWLIEDIRENGEAETLEEARERPVPEFPAEALRDCPPAG
ncbi:DUF305 domain-containing protein [Blastococcus sp. KM273128]|uniref:DUF305 domain-containing protein n=1 Tax=Blastococcus sp. KM273128 TaxID=2570314 RepID=UPI001F250C76|nr:DUF305 domain-containing protein [Blastococcus sp. KM273128]MCF6746362.1 DUF305 domain-containing protein [Blastococcus sp. KM273128]